MTEKMDVNSARRAGGPVRARIAAVIVALALAAASALAGCGNGGGKPGSPSSTPGPGYGLTAPHSASVITQHTRQ